MQFSFFFPTTNFVYYCQLFLINVICFQQTRPTETNYLWPFWSYRRTVKYRCCIINGGRKRATLVTGKHFVYLISQFNKYCNSLIRMHMVICNLECCLVSRWLYRQSIELWTRYSHLNASTFKLHSMKDNSFSC